MKWYLGGNHHMRKGLAVGKDLRVGADRRVKISHPCPVAETKAVTPSGCVNRSVTWRTRIASVPPAQLREGLDSILTGG